MREFKKETCYAVKEIPNVTINCKYKNGKYVKFYCDVLTEFSFENYDSKIICKLTTALMSNSLWTEVMFNNLNQNFTYNMKLNIDLNDNNGGIYNGYVYKGKATSGNEYRFIRETL